VALKGGDIKQKEQKESQTAIHKKLFKIILRTNAEKT